MRSYTFGAVLFVSVFCNSLCNAQSIVSIAAGNGTNGFSGDGGPATAASFGSTQGLCFDTSGNLYIADVNHHRIRKVNPAGIVNTVVGNGSGAGGDGGPATAAGISSYGVSCDPAGDLLIGDWGNQRIRRVNAATGIITTVAGNGTSGYSGDGGPATNAKLSEPIDACLDLANNIIISDYGNDKIRKVDAITGIITTIAQINSPVQLVVDGEDNIYVAAQSGYVYKINASGVMTTVAGGGTGSASGVPATSTSLAGPEGVAVDCSGNVIIADNDHQLIRRVDAITGIITTIAGTGSGTNNVTVAGVPALSASFHNQLVCFDLSSNLYCSTDQAPYVYKITNVSTPPNISISGGSVCVGSSLALSSSFGIGTWSSSDTTVATITPATGIVTGIAVGTTVISFTTSLGCIVTATVTVVSPEFIPNAFTPNEDGKNDMFRVVNVKYEKYFVLQVFNRWGQQVFYSADPNIGWDGTFNGVAQQMDVYNYLVKITRPDGSEKLYKGNVTLLR